MKIDKTRIGVSLCCAAALLGTATYAVSPAFAANANTQDDSSYVSLDEDSALKTFEIPRNGKVGDQYVNGDMTIEIVTKEEVARAASEDTDNGGTDNSSPAEDTSSQGDVESGRMARIKIWSGGEYVSTVDAETLAAADKEVVISGEIGESYIVGDLIFEIVSKEEVQAAAADDLTRASTKRWSIDLSGDSMSKDFEVTSSYPYAKVWIDNDGSGDIKFTITKTSPTGTVVSGSNVSLPAGTTAVVYSSKKWSAATYYANFTSGKSSMSGTAACRVASTIEELDI